MSRQFERRALIPNPSPEGRGETRADERHGLTRRRLLIASAAWPALAWSGAAFGQARRPPLVIGWLNANVRGRRNIAAFKEGMAALGWKEGSGYVLEERWAEGQPDRLPALAQELKAKNPAVIVTAPSTTVTAAAARAAPSTPIVQGNGGDLVVVGLAASFARPGGMVTGVTNSFMEVSAKFLELLLAAAPKLKHIGILLDSTLHASFRATHMETVRRASTQLSVEARIAENGKREEIEPALARLAKEGAQGLIVLPGTGWFNDERTRILETSLTQRWPVIGGPLQWAEQGALLSYGPELPALYRRAAWYVDRILKGRSPAISQSSSPPSSISS